MNKEEIFNKVRNHLLEQGEKSMISNQPNSLAAHRGHNGMKCAVGCLIAEEHYSPKLEGLIPERDNPLGRALIASGIPDDEEIFRILRKLREIHDWYLPDTWAGTLNFYAQVLGVK